MRRYHLAPFLAITALLSSACGETGPVDTPSAVDEARTGRPPRRGYHVFRLPSLEGASSEGNSINNLSIVAGTANNPDNASVQAVAWLYGLKVPLGTLGGPNSAIIWPVKNNRGWISGISETEADDPLDEAWSCSAFFPTTTGRVCRGFVWRDGAMHALPTFGGTHGFATGTNNHGVTAGWAENTVRDPTCNPPQKLQFRAALWGPSPQRIRELPPLAGDSTSAATALNDRGQVVGISGSCSNAVGEYSARHAVLWEDGQVIDLGNLGGEAWNTPMAINQRGDVVGFANVAGVVPPNDFDVRAFLWTRRERRMQNLGTLEGDGTSQALGINERGQVVGVSCGARCTAVLYENGAVVDLNTLVTSGSDDFLRVAGDINDFGVITGQSQSSTGTRYTFIAVPTVAHGR